MIIIKDLDEAIQHYLEVAEMNQSIADNTEHGNWMDIAQCEKCAEEHRQLAEWLKELKNIYDFIEKYPSTDAIYIGDIKDILKGEI